MASEMVSIKHFDWMAQIYLPKIEWRHGALTIDLDCVLRVGAIYRGCPGLGVAIFGFGFGVCWPSTEEAKLAWARTNFWHGA